MCTYVQFPAACEAKLELVKMCVVQFGTPRAFVYGRLLNISCILHANVDVILMRERDSQFLAALPRIAANPNSIILFDQAKMYYISGLEPPRTFGYTALSRPPCTLMRRNWS